MSLYRPVVATSMLVTDVGDENFATICFEDNFEMSMTVMPTVG